MIYSIRVSSFCLLVLFSNVSPSPSIEKRVSSITDLQQAISTANPGDRIIVANGVYSTTESITISKQGTAEKPITIKAETIGDVEISGTNGFVISAPSSYIIIKGFRFTHKTGTCRIEPGAIHCLITRNVFECVLAGTSGAKPYLNVSGDDNEISFNTFQNKKDEGQMISVQGPGGDRMAKRTWIHHNYFYNFPPTANNCSAIQIGLSGRSMDSAFCTVEYNLFVKTEGENEGAICHKSCNNIIRFNTFGERSEECSIRHGNNSQIYGNFFINTTGLRFSGDDHLIYGNYFLRCKKAIVCTNGDGEVKEGSKLTCHDRADRVKVIYNTIVECESGFQMPDRNNGLGATQITFSNNLIRGGAPVSIRGSFPGAVWEGNILWNTSGGDMPASGFRTEEINMNQPFFQKNPDPSKYPGIPLNNRPLTTDDVGTDAPPIPLKGVLIHEK
jgi:poly(beta-D-mannuronate) lyase